MKAKKKTGFCNTRGCTRCTTGGRKHCNTCRTRKSRAADPVKASYIARKHNAKRRGKPFTITLEYFRKWCVKVNYFGYKRGRAADSYTVDCIINELGYVPGNLQLLTNRDNVKKYITYDWQRKEVHVTTETVYKDSDLPF